MEWIIYLSFIFLPIVFIWFMLWAIEKKVPVRPDEEVGNNGGKKLILSNRDNKKSQRVQTVFFLDCS